MLALQNAIQNLDLQTFSNELIAIKEIKSQKAPLYHWVVERYNEKTTDTTRKMTLEELGLFFSALITNHYPMNTYNAEKESIFFYILRVGSDPFPEALLLQDFEEAKPVLAEWNQNCRTFYQELKHTNHSIASLFVPSRFVHMISTGSDIIQTSYATALALKTSLPKLIHHEWIEAKLALEHRNANYKLTRAILEGNAVLLGEAIDEGADLSQTYFPKNTTALNPTESHSLIEMSAALNAARLSMLISMMKYHPELSLDGVHTETDKGKTTLYLSFESLSNQFIVTVGAPTFKGSATNHAEEADPSTLEATPRPSSPIATPEPLEGPGKEGPDLSVKGLLALLFSGVKEIASSLAGKLANTYEERALRKAAEGHDVYALEQALKSAPSPASVLAVNNIPVAQSLLDSTVGHGDVLARLLTELSEVRLPEQISRVAATDTTPAGYMLKFHHSMGSDMSIVCTQAPNTKILESAQRDTQQTALTHT